MTSFSGVSEKDRADLEAGIGNLEIPELVLDDDGHLFWIFALQVLREANARRAGQEGDEEMMVARRLLVAATSLSTLRITPRNASCARMS